MEIKFLGHSSFMIKGNKQVIVTDPYDDKVGKFPSVKADIVTCSHDHHDHHAVDKVDGNPKVIDFPGEYEIGGTFIEGIPTFHDGSQGSERGENIVFSFYMEDIHVVHLGDLGHKLNDEQLDKIGDVDILMIPVGGVYTIDAAQAQDVIEEIEPRIVIPMHYQMEGIDISGGIAPVTGFLKAMGVGEPKTEESLKISKATLPQEGMDIVVLKK